MRKIVTSFAGLVLACGLTSVAAKAQTTVPLGPATSAQGVLFTGNSNGNGSLAVQVGGCPPGSTGCSVGPVTGNLGSAIVGGTIFLYGPYSINADSLSASFLGTSASNVDTWSLTGAADPFSVSITAFEGPENQGLEIGTSTVGGSIDWTGLTENAAGIFLSGTADYTVSGFLANDLGSSGSASFNIELAPLTVCADIPAGASCTLATVAGVGGDPPTVFSLVGSGNIGGSGPSTGTSGVTPEPGTLLLLGSGLTALGFIRRKLSVT